jgi:MFS family permease
LCPAARRFLPGSNERTAAAVPVRPNGRLVDAIWCRDGAGVKRGFYTILAAQFFSSLADNALLIAAISLLVEMDEPAWMAPLLKLFFAVAYVVLAPYVGAFADAMPKGRVMFLTNGLKIVGCSLMFFNVHPLLAYAVVGVGAAAYSPAKYGILTELLPPRQLVVANGWMEGLTVASIILGTLLGGALLGPKLSSLLLAFDFPLVDTGIDTPAEAAICVVMGAYAIAATFNLFIPHTGVDHRAPSKNPLFLVHEFGHCCKLLWKDRLGQITLATTTLFWGAGAALQFIILKWAEHALNYPLSKGAMLQGVVGIGTAIGAVLAARMVPLHRAVNVLPMGALMGVLVLAMIFVHTVTAAVLMMIAIGALAGFFVVAMNALLQHRGHILMGAGHSIAVQNFNENLSNLVMLGLYAGMISLDIPINGIITFFALFVVLFMLLVMRRHRYNLSRGDMTHLVVVEKGEAAVTSNTSSVRR